MLGVSFQKPDDAVSLADSLASGAVSSLSSGEGEEQEKELSQEYHVTMNSTILAAGTKGTYVHVLSPEATDQDAKIKCKCGSALGRNGAVMEVAALFHVGAKQPCPQCRQHFDPIILRELW